MNCFGVKFELLTDCERCAVKESCKRKYISTVLMRKQRDEIRARYVERGREINELKCRITILKRQIENLIKPNKRRG